MFFYATDRLINQAYQRGLESYPLHDIQKASVLALGPFVFDEINAAAGVPTGGVLGEKEQGRERRSRLGTGEIEEVIIMSQGALGFPGIPDFGHELVDGRAVQILPAGIEDRLPLVGEILFRSLQFLDLFHRQGRGLGADPVKGASAGHSVDLQARTDFQPE